MWGIVELQWSIGDIVVLLDVVSMLSKDGRGTNPHTKFGAPGNPGGLRRHRSVLGAGK